MSNFAHFDKPIEELSDRELAKFYVGLHFEADPGSEQNQKNYEAFKAELPTRSKWLQDEIAFINTIII